jgi:predicted CoA-substrate-specific enzyme activase
MELKNKTFSLGIDIGSVSVAYVILNNENEIISSDYRFHSGNILTCLRDSLDKLEWSRISHIGYNQKAAEFFSAGISVNDQIALVEGIKSKHKNIRSLFTIGGETFGLILFDQDQNYLKYISNSSCAAGTGSFLDQQAERLGLKNSTELSEKALSYEGDPPKIATRCAVFAKTDLIHCQQQGYSLSAICAGLCKGLALNIADALLGGITLSDPVFVVGGVSKNRKVLSYLSEVIGRPVSIPETSLLTSAIGCALRAKEQRKYDRSSNTFALQELINEKTEKKHYFFGPLHLKLSKFPDFSAHHHYLADDVEVDIYDIPKGLKQVPVYVGLDIGSTSTKTVLMTANRRKNKIIAGLYTRTRGQPIVATQALFRQISEIETSSAVNFKVLGTGTTGSGRKFLQKILNADYAVDEITAHARAAYELNPKIDTIIEIGGQDSKFTMMNKGQVTFSVMNYVCAAGTGSFIEEQAKRLDIQLEEYADLAMHTPSPLTSDRCTVFMERDINHFLSQGYSKQELLAGTLHSVRDNYLAKVAHISKIGDVVCFQGATAKNAALVSAFEHKMNKPIFVSRYCHLTGALGVCLILKEHNLKSSSFRGLDFYKEKLTVEEEICEYCNNHCKLNRVFVGGEIVSWGYLCGRDETGKTRRHLEKKQFDFLRSRRRIFTPAKELPAKIQNINENDQKPLLGIDIDISLDKLKENFEVNLMTLRHKIFTITQDDVPVEKLKSNIKIGLPDTLYMQEYLPFWHYLLSKLGYSVVRGPNIRNYVKKGKEVSAAEFCAPISAWHGNLDHLSEKTDFVFAPQMFEEEGDLTKKNYCYYSNYAVSIIRNLPKANLGSKIIAPVIDFSQPPMHNIHQIYENLPQGLKFTQSPADIQEAYHEAWQWFIAQKNLLIDVFKKQQKSSSDISVVLLGRPYLVMDGELNKKIPQKFNDMGIATFFQDMLPWAENSSHPASADFLEWNHWKYGLEILESSEYIGQHEGLYPVFLTAFKCSPDSFLLHYFKEIMTAFDRPYLILQIDEHGSDVGYETRIESAVQTFRNHHKKKSRPEIVQKPSGIHLVPYRPETVLIPDYDTLSCSLISAAFEKAGYKSYLVEQSETTIASSLRLNDGQCLPICAISQAAIETIEKYDLNPDKTALFLNTITNLACNFPQYPIMAKKIFEDVGHGYENLQIFASEFEMKEFPIEVISDVYTGYLLGGLLRKIACRIRPYEIVPGTTDMIIEEGRQSLYDTTVMRGSREQVFNDILTKIGQIPVSKEIGTKPKVSIIGDLYVRDNDVFNQQLILELELYGAEVVTTPFTYVLRLLAFKHKNILKEDGRFISLMKFRLLIEYLEKIERKYYKIADNVLQEHFPPLNDKLFDILEDYDLILDHGGETSQNLLKIFALIEQYADLSLFIHVNPIFCCPGLVSESIFKKVEKDIGIPIISITYDGTTTRRNDILAPYIHYLKQTIPR